MNGKGYWVRDYGEGDREYDCKVLSQSCSYNRMRFVRQTSIREDKNASVGS